MVLRVLFAKQTHTFLFKKETQPGQQVAMQTCSINYLLVKTICIHFDPTCTFESFSHFLQASDHNLLILFWSVDSKQTNVTSKMWFSGFIYMRGTPLVF